MSNAMRLFRDDLKRLGRNTITILTVLGLVALPSIFSWYNIIACWSVFDNTGNLTVAVADTDEGYKSDLMPITVNIGNEVTSALRANDQLNWVFTNEDDAVDGVRAGRYYAAVVIPPSFSRDMMSFYTDDMTHARITYYSNQKKSAIAPKVTDQGADQVSNQVNTVFEKTLSDIALSVSSALLDYASTSDIDGRVGALSGHIDRIGDRLDDSARTLRSYASVLDSAHALVQNSGQLLEQARDATGDGSSVSADAEAAAQDAAKALEDASSKLAETLVASTGDVENVSAAVDTAFEKTAAASAKAEEALRKLSRIANDIGDTKLSSRLAEAADKVKAAGDKTAQTRASAKEAADKAAGDLGSADTRFQSDLKPKLEQLSEVINRANAAIADASGTLDSAGSELASSAHSVSSGLEETRAKITGAADDLEASASRLRSLSERIDEALASDDIKLIRDVIGSDPEMLASAIAAPVQIERNAIYPVENFGSAMSPLYTTLALWIGALLIMVTLKIQPSQRSLEQLDSPTARQVFMGRFGVVSAISLMQSSCLAIGNMLFLEVQVENPVLYLLCFWIAGLVFAFIIYTMVALFANLGKALGVILLIVQVSGGGGSFPLQLLPDFFQSMSPYLPISHAVNAMRAAMFGIYNGDFWIELGKLALFVAPFIVLGLLLQAPLGKIVPKFIARIEKSKLV